MLATGYRTRTTVTYCNVATAVLMCASGACAMGRGHSGRVDREDARYTQAAYLRVLPCTIRESGETASGDADKLSRPLATMKRFMLPTLSTST